jgi:hypothetical protein
MTFFRVISNFGSMTSRAIKLLTVYRINPGAFALLPILGQVYRKHQSAAGQKAAIIRMIGAQASVSKIQD